MLDNLLDGDFSEIQKARDWFSDYDGPKFKNCDPSTGCFSASIGFNTENGGNVRGVSIIVQSCRESDTVLGLYRIVNG